MEIGNSSKALSVLLKCSPQTVTSLAEQLNLTRPGTWKILKKLEKEEILSLEKVGKGKTSAAIAKLNWKNPLTARSLAAILTRESQEYRRWTENFSGIGKKASWVTLFGSIFTNARTANDIDLLCIAKKRDIGDIDQEVTRIQKTQEKKIHATILTKEELTEELKVKSPMRDAVRTGIVLWGHEQFVDFMQK